MSDLTCLQEWNRWAEGGKTVIETLTELNNRYRKVDNELNLLKAEHLKLHQSLAKTQLAAVPLCIGRPIIDILAKEGQWISETGQGIVAADDLFRNSPYDSLDEANADRFRLREAHLEILSIAWSGLEQGAEAAGKAKDISTKALTAPPPPVVAKADADALADALETCACLPIARMYPDGPCMEAADHKEVTDILETYRAKYQSPCN